MPRILPDRPATRFLGSVYHKTELAGWSRLPCLNGWVDDAATAGFTPDPSQKLRAGVFRDIFRASEKVCHYGVLSGFPETCDYVAV